MASSRLCVDAGWPDTRDARESASFAPDVKQSTDGPFSSRQSGRMFGDVEPPAPATYPAVGDLLGIQGNEIQRDFRSMFIGIAVFALVPETAIGIPGRDVGAGTTLAMV